MCTFSGLLGYCHLLGASQNSDGEQETSHHRHPPEVPPKATPHASGDPGGSMQAPPAQETAIGLELPAPHQSHIATDHVRDLYKAFTSTCSGLGFFQLFHSGSCLYLLLSDQLSLLHVCDKKLTFVAL